MGRAIVYTDTTVITMDPALPRADGVRIAEGRITHVWRGTPPGGLTGDVVALRDAVILPGLVDSHLHLSNLGAQHRQVQLAGAESLRAVVTRVRGVARRVPSGTWIRGHGWDDNEWSDGRLPTAADLDVHVAAHPVWLTRNDGHAVWLNSLALRLAGIVANTPDPPGGCIVRGEDGAPTGVLIDNAIDVATDALPPRSPEELREDLRLALARCARAGLTGVHDMGMTLEELEALEQLDERGELPVRVTAYLFGHEADLESLLATPVRRQGMLRVVGVKLFADGALGSHGAALLEPYADRPETRGLMLTEPRDLAERSRRIAEAGYQVALHAIGDRGVRAALDALAAAREHCGAARHRIEHAQVLHPDDVSRFAQLDAVASMQPLHATGDMAWAQARLGPERLRGAYAWRTLAEAGALLTFGSDAPVESENPWTGIHAAVTRQDATGQPRGGWMPEQTLTIERALWGYTVGPARAISQDGGGMICVGAPGDLSIVDHDPMTVTPATLLRMRTRRTVLGGRELFVRAEDDSHGAL